MTDIEVKEMSERVNKYNGLKMYLNELTGAIKEIEKQRVVSTIQTLEHYEPYRFSDAPENYRDRFCRDVLVSLCGIKVDVEREMEEL